MRAVVLAVVVSVAALAAVPVLAAPLSRGQDRPGALGVYVGFDPGDRAATIEAFLGTLPSADDLIRIDLCLTRRASEPGAGDATFAGALGNCLLEAKR